MGPEAADPDVVEIETDRMIDELSTIVEAGGPTGEAARYQLWYGVLMTALESELVRRVASGFEEEGRTLVGASFAMGAPLTLWDGAAIGPPSEASALARALEDGKLVAVPGDAATATTWWDFDPVTAAIRSVGPREAGMSALNGIPNLRGNYSRPTRPTGDPEYGLVTISSPSPISAAWHGSATR